MSGFYFALDMGVGERNWGVERRNFAVVGRIMQCRFVNKNPYLQGFIFPQNGV